MHVLHPLHRSATPEWRAFEAALGDCKLPTADLDEPDQHFFSLIGPSEVLGYGGYLLAGEDALLRSIMVPAAGRRQGSGAALVGILLDHLGAIGVRRVWLLTTDAAAFFKRLGFAEVDRLSAPASITSARQFSDICPSTATLICRNLTQG